MHCFCFWHVDRCRAAIPATDCRIAYPLLRRIRKCSVVGRAIRANDWRDAIAQLPQIDLPPQSRPKYVAVSRVHGLLRKRAAGTTPVIAMPGTRYSRRSDRDIVQCPWSTKVNKPNPAVGVAVPGCAKACPSGENLAEVGHCGWQTTARRLFVFYNFGHGDDNDRRQTATLSRLRSCSR
jgi:hypothetical protein